MTETETWDIYFSGICAIRFHPRDDGRIDDIAKVKRAAKIADLMIKARRARQCQDGEQQSAA